MLEYIDRLTQGQENKNVRMYLPKFDSAWKYREEILENAQKVDSDIDAVEVDIELLSKKVMKEIDDTETDEQ